MHNFIHRNFRHRNFRQGTLFLFLIALVLSVTTPQGGFAQQKTRLGGGPITEKVLRTLDQDKNGSFSAAEITSASRQLYTLDKDKDSTVTIFEMGGPGPITGMLRYQPLIRVLDKNGDIDLSPQEVKSASQSLLQLDRNKNGQIEKSEITYERAQDPGIGELHQRRKILLNEYLRNVFGEIMPGTNPGVSEGYTLIQETSNHNDVQVGRHTYLINGQAQIVHAWLNELHSPESSSAILLPNGILARTASTMDWIEREKYPTGAHGTLELVAHTGERLWAYTLETPGKNVLHHDFLVLPSGNLLVSAYIGFTHEEAAQIGFDTSLANGETIWFESVIELEVDQINKSARLAWQWNSWNHVVQDKFPDKPNYGNIADHPDRININAFPLKQLPFNAGEIHQINALSYHAGLDQILLSSAATGEIWVIDHSTSRQEAATNKGGQSGKGGRLLYRWGNPVMIGDTESPRQLFWQQDVQWLDPFSEDNTDILLINAGLDRDPDGSYNPNQKELGVLHGRSSVLEMSLPWSSKGYTPNKAPKTIWSWNTDGAVKFYTPFSSAVKRMPNGNTLIMQSHKKRILEVTKEGVLLEDFSLPGPGRVFRIDKLSPNYSGLAPLYSSN